VSKLKNEFSYERLEKIDSDMCIHRLIGRGCDHTRNKKVGARSSCQRGLCPLRGTISHRC